MGALATAYVAFLATFEGPAQILCVALIVLGARRLPALWRQRSRAETVFVAGIALWWVAGLVAYLLGAERGSTGDLTRPLMALGAVSGALMAQTSGLRRWVWVFGGLCALNAVFGLAQWGFGPFFFDGWFVRDLKSPQLYIPGRVFHELAASGSFYNRVRFAFVMGFALLLALAAGMQANLPRSRRLTALLMGLLVATALSQSYVRGVLLAAVGAGVLAIVVYGRRTVMAAGGLALVSAAAFAFDRVRVRLSRIPEDFETRRVIWDSAVKVWQQAPVFGVGHGRYRLAVEPFAGTQLAGARLNSAHSLPLMIVAESGVVGLLGFGVAVAAVVWAVGRGVRRAPELPWCLAAVLMPLAAGLVHFSLHHATVGLIFWTAAGYGLVRARP